MKFQLSLPVVSFVALFSGILPAQNFVNGDFETNRPATGYSGVYPDSWSAFSTWSSPMPSSVTPDWLYLEFNDDAVVVLESDNIAPIGDSNYPSGYTTGLSQQIGGFSIGETYTLNFEAAYLDELVTPSLTLNPNVGGLQLYLDGVLVSTFDLEGISLFANTSAGIAGPLPQFNFQFTATSATHTIGFRAIETANAAGSDLPYTQVIVNDFSVVPEAGATILVLGTALGLALRRFRVV